MTPSRGISPHLPAQQRLDALIDRQGAELAAVGREGIRAALAELPTANRVVDQRGGVLRVHFTPGMQVEQAILAVAFHAYWVCYDFPHGNRMMDCDELLRRHDSGSYHYVIQGLGDADDIEVRLLLRDAAHRAPVPLNPENRARLFFRDELA